MNPRCRQRPFGAASMASQSLHCPNCKTLLGLGQIAAIPLRGEKVRCTHCGAVFVILPAGSAPPAGPQSTSHPQSPPHSATQLPQGRRGQPPPQPFHRFAFLLGRTITIGTILVCGLSLCFCASWLFDSPHDSPAQNGATVTKPAPRQPREDKLALAAKRFTAAEILALKRENAKGFRDNVEGDEVYVRGTLHFKPIFLAYYPELKLPAGATAAVVLELEGSSDFTHDSPRVMVFFFQWEKAQFTPKFLDWVQVAQAGDHIEVFGTVRPGTATKQPVIIYDAKLTGF